MGSLRVGILVSGRGSNLQALLDAAGSGEIAAEIVVVVSNHAGAYALQRAEARGVPTAVLERKGFSSRAAHQRAIADVLARAEVELVVLAGFDRVLEAEFITAFPSRIINIHPSLLPAFGGGLHAQADALAYGVKVSGCTVHFVTNDIDAGPIIVQATVPVLDEDTADTLAARILEQEHRILPRAVGLIAEDRLVIEGRRVRVRPGEPPVGQ